MKRRWMIPGAALALGALAGWTAVGRKKRYTLITQEQARAMMAADDGPVIVDVRREDEFAAGHIPGAVCIPVETIGTARPAELPDPDQVILIYCRRGSRSRRAAQKLGEMGYTRVFSFGGIDSWTGEITSEAPTDE